MCPDVPGVAEVKDQFDFAHQVLAAFISSFILGGVTILSLVVRRPLFQSLLAIFFGLAGVALFNSTSNFQLIGIQYSNWILIPAVALIFLALVRYIFSSLEPIRETLRRFLIPHLWDERKYKPSSFDDLAKRWFVTVAGAAGSMTGVALANAKTESIILAAISPNQVFFTFFLTIISFVLIGPGEEFVLGATFQPSHPIREEPPHSSFEELLTHVSLSAVGRFLLVLAAWFALNIVHKCMDDVLSNGDLTSAMEFLFACIPAGVITYYWCAALQHAVPNVARSSAVATSVLMSLLFFFLSFVLVTAVLLAVFVGGSPGLQHMFSMPYVGLSALLLGMVSAALVALLGCAVIYGVVSYLGGIILNIDRNRPERVSFYTVVRLSILTICWNGPLAWVGLYYLIPQCHLDRADFYFLLGNVIWGFGLLVSKFPQIVERARTNSSGARHA